MLWIWLEADSWLPLHSTLQRPTFYQESRWTRCSAGIMITSRLAMRRARATHTGSQFCIQTISTMIAATNGLLDHPLQSPLVQEVQSTRANPLGKARLL